MALTAILLVLVVVALLACLLRHAKSRPPNFPPGPPRLPVYGNWWQILLRDYMYPHKGLKSMADDYKTPLLGLYLGEFLTVVANDYESVKELFQKPEFQGRPDVFSARIRSWNKLHGIFFTDGDYWAQQRRFSLRHMRDFGFGRRFSKLEDAVSEEIKVMLQALRGESLPTDKSVARGRQVLLPDLFYSGLTNSLMEVMCGPGGRLPPAESERARKMARGVLAFQRAGDSAGGAINYTPWIRHFWPRGSGYRGLVDGNQAVMDFVSEYVKDQRGNLDEDAMRGFVDVYLSEIKRRSGEGSSFTDRQMVLTVMDFLFPAATALPVALSFSVLYMMRYPDKADRAFQEIVSVVGRGRLPDLDDRPNLPYTEAFLREVLRFTGTPLAMPHRATEDTYWRGYFIPKDTIMMPNLWAAHHDPLVFEKPHEFKPERFLNPVTGALRRKDYTMPFGNGKRLCAGETFARQNTFLFLAALLQNFVFSLPPGETLPHEDDVLYGFIVSPKEFWVQVAERP